MCDVWLLRVECWDDRDIVLGGGGDEVHEEVLGYGETLGSYCLLDVARGVCLEVSCNDCQCGGIQFADSIEHGDKAGGNGGFIMALDVIYIAQGDMGFFGLEGGEEASSVRCGYVVYDRWG